jgi:hypothetical protein
MKTSKNRGWLWLALFGLASLGGDCEGDIVSDPTFRDWCGDALCQWKLLSGVIQRVQTWNSYDLGVAFVDTPTAISQATDESSATCILFTSVADLDPESDMVLKVDFNSDGSFEYIGPLGSTYWEKVQTEITAPPAYQGITFVLEKEGTGTAVLAEMRIQSTGGCTARPPPIAPNLEFGEKCETSATCADHLTCTGAPTDLLCSQCSSTVPCPDGEACKTRSVFFPSQCAPGEGLGKAGTPCVNGSDCSSGVCEGSTPVPLADAGDTCDLDAALGSSNPDNCKWFGVRGGECR